MEKGVAFVLAREAEGFAGATAVEKGRPMKQFVTEESFWELFPEAQIGIVVAHNMKPTEEVAPEDAAAIARLAEDAVMGTLTPRGTSYVALDGDRIVGFIRIVEAEGDRYVSPIVVDPQARRLGVGRALMQDARTRYGALLFVARGPAVPFYTALGCEQVERERISPDLGEDCDTCPDFAAFRPVPMIYR